MNFEFSMPTAIQFGLGVSKNAGITVRNTGAQRIFFIYDAEVEAAGLVTSVRESLKKTGLDLYEYDGVIPNVPDYQVEEAVALAQEYTPDAIVAVGGGSTLDCAKIVNILLTNPAPISKYDGFHLVRHPGKPFVAIPTTAGSGSEVSIAAVLTDTAITRRRLIFGIPTTFQMALIDPELTYSLPPELTAATGMNALAQAMESYCSPLASPVSCTLALESITVLARNIQQAYLHGRDVAAREEMLLGSTLAGMCCTNTSLGLVQSIAHPLSAHCNVPHSLANAVTLGAVMEFNIPAIQPKQMEQIAFALGLPVHKVPHEQLGRSVANQLYQITEDLHIPRLRDCGVPESILPVIAYEAAQVEISTLTTPRKPTQEDVLRLLQNIW